MRSEVNNVGTAEAATMRTMMTTTASSTIVKPLRCARRRFIRVASEIARKDGIGFQFVINNYLCN